MRLRRLREGSHLTLRDLAFPGCSPGYLSRIERGDRVPSLDVLIQLGRRLGVSAWYLASGNSGNGAPIPGLDAAREPNGRGGFDLLKRALALAETREERAWVLAELGQTALVGGDRTLAVGAFRQALALLAP